MWSGNMYFPGGIRALNYFRGSLYRGKGGSLYRGMVGSPSCGISGSLSVYYPVSPYITAKRTDLLDIFMGHFKRKYNKSFQLIHKVDIKNQDPTLAVRIFSVS